MAPSTELTADSSVSRSIVVGAAIGINICKEKKGGSDTPLVVYHAAGLVPVPANSSTAAAGFR